MEYQGKKYFFLAFLALFLSFSCSKKIEPTPYEQVYEMARKFDETIYEVMIIDNHKRVICENYGLGCLEGTGKRWMVRTIELPIIGFENEELAKKEAIRLNQYYYKNWLFDEIKDEPVLESFVKEVYKIKSAKEMHPSE
jgi:hypothetical protein